MKNFSPLTRHLRGQPANHVPMSFGEIESLLGVKLPHSAEAYRAWWSNNPSNNPMTKAWLDAGFKSEQVDLSERKVVFKRTSPPLTGSAPPSTDSGVASDPAFSRPALFGWLAGTVVLAPGVDLAAPADPDWGSRIDAE